MVEAAYLESSEVDDTVDLGVLGEDLVEGLLVDNIDIVEVRAAAADELDAVKGNLGGVVEVVDNHDIVAVLEECQRGEGANVSGTTVPGEEGRLASKSHCPSLGGD